MNLFYREYGKGEPIIIAHGLFGMSDNWIRVAKKLSVSNKVYVLDMRNHGQSPHYKTHTYKDMANDFIEFIKSLNIAKAIFIGHSMGGKAIMEFANIYPEFIKKMIIIDISPRKYIRDDYFNAKTINHSKLLNEFSKVELKKFNNRKEYLNYFDTIFNNIFILQLIQKNIKKNENGEFIWKINVETLLSNLDNLSSEINLSNKIKSIDSMFVFGCSSPYYNKYIDEKIIKKAFNKLKIITIKDAGHIIHIEKEQELTNILLNFINNNT